MKSIITILLAAGLTGLGYAHAADAQTQAPAAPKAHPPASHPPHTHAAEKGTIPQPEHRPKAPHKKRRPSANRHEHGKERH